MKLKLTIIAGNILKEAKRVFKVPDFKYYALGDGLSNILNRSSGILFDLGLPPPQQPFLFKLE
jgi:hypothetical protein